MALQGAIDGVGAQHGMRTGVLVIKANCKLRMHASMRSMSQSGASWALDALLLNSEQRED